YRGTDATAYEDVFDQESGKDDLTPLTDFLQFINESSDADFEAGIGKRFDLEAFATYRAFENLIDNYDAIDGPGNNSYLWWDRASSRMTVIGWDHNLTFGVSNRPGAGGAARPGGVGAAGGAKGGPGGKTNVLVTRVEKLSDWADRYSAATTAVQKVLTEQGPAVLDQWAGLLTAKATDLVSAATVQSDRAVIAPYLGV
ncbi:MAG TPA: CotH kinase family protein, partial [Phycicoccus sp.]|nr:CotH kinase family protein [Phycicoccus sp.]